MHCSPPARQCDAIRSTVLLGTKFVRRVLDLSFRIDGFSRRTRLINADAILLETLNRLCVSVFRFETLRPDQKSIGVNNP
jgi:hypothetical protein